MEKLTYWERNSTILNKRFPGLLEEIVQGKDGLTEEDLKIETAASGVPTMLIKGLYVHSPRDPEREGKRLAEACLAELGKDGEKAGPVVVLGFGLGYTAQALADATESAEKTLQRPIIIVEKNPCILRKAFELRDFNHFLSRPGVAFIVAGTGEAVITALALFEKNAAPQNQQPRPEGTGYVVLDKYLYSGFNTPYKRPKGRGIKPLNTNKPDGKYTPHIIRNRTLTGIDEQWYASVENRISAWAMRDDVNQATLKKFGKRWVRNLMCNMSAIRDLPGVSRLARIAAANDSSGELPVFLAAAGPSLDSIACLLPEIHKRCIVVAVDTSLRFLSRNNIAPDFTLVVDPQFWNSRHLDRCINPVTRLIVESAVYPQVLHLPFKEKYFCGSMYPLGIFMEKRVDQKGSLGAGGSVATTAWDFAVMLGAQQIWIAGLDLAFPGLRTHFKGAQFEEKALAESGRLNPTETWLIHALRDGIPFKAPSLSGGEVLTDRRLSLYATWFENRFSQFPTVQNYIIKGTGEWGGRSASESGLAIKGLELVGSEALLALPECREEINQRLDAASSRILADFFNPIETQRRSERYETATKALFSGLQQIQIDCEKGIKIAEQALSQEPCQASTVNREKTFAALDEINRCIDGSEVKEIASFLIPREVSTLDSNIQPGNTEASFRNYLESSIRLYKSLANSVNLI